MTVSIITYNHEGYIAQAIQGALNQQTSFPVEILVGEDCSPDNTRQVITDLQRRHPGRITLRAYDKNVGATQNYVDGLKQATGDYIATLDGDDYWISPHKLADQVALMEAHPDLSMCFHPVIAVSEGRDPSIAYPRDRKPRYDLREMAEWIGISQLSALLRTSHRPDPLPQWFYDCPCGDWPTYVMWAHSGPIGYIDEVYGVHRQHAGSIWSAMRADRIAALQTNVEMVEVLMDNEVTEKDWLVRVRARRYFDIAHELVAAGRRREANAFVRKAWRDTGFYNRNVYRLEPFKYALAWVAPSLEGRLRELKRRYLSGSGRHVPLDERHREMLKSAQ